MASARSAHGWVDVGGAAGEVGRAKYLPQHLLALSLRPRNGLARVVEEGRERAVVEAVHQLDEVVRVGGTALQPEEDGRQQRRGGARRLLLREAELARQ